MIENDIHQYSWIISWCIPPFFGQCTKVGHFSWIVVSIAIGIGVAGSRIAQRRLRGDDCSPHSILKSSSEEE
jgi:hypothetical protein